MTAHVLEVESVRTPEIVEPLWHTVSWRPLSAASSPPDTYRLLSVFSGIPTPPLEAMRKSGLFERDEQGKPRFPLATRKTLSVLVDAGWIRWVNWSKAESKDDQPIPAGYVLTGLGEGRLGGFFDQYGPVWPRP